MEDGHCKSQGLRQFEWNVCSAKVGNIAIASLTLTFVEIYQLLTASKTSWCSHSENRRLPHLVPPNSLRFTTPLYVPARTILDSSSEFELSVYERRPFGHIYDSCWIINNLNESVIGGVRVISDVAEWAGQSQLGITWLLWQRLRIARFFWAYCMYQILCCHLVNQLDLFNLALLRSTVFSVVFVNVWVI